MVSPANVSRSPSERSAQAFARTSRTCTSIIESSCHGGGVKSVGASGISS